MPNSSVKGMVFNIQRYSLHDGPGIRTTVFLSGCGLACAWCSNPESKSLRGRLMHNEKRCLRCGRCVAACLEGAITMIADEPRIDRERCTLCGECANTCAPHALHLSATEMSVSDVMAVVEADRPFYRRSGGGVTLSGGEPLLQPDFAREILTSARSAGINTALETAGLVAWPALEAVLPLVDYLLYDVKHLDVEAHRRGTGASNAVILDNLVKAAPLARSLIVRVPIVPGFNACNSDVRSIALFARDLHADEVHLLPYHRLGQAKYGQLDQEYSCEEVEPLSKEREEELAVLVAGLGVTVRIRG